LIERKLWFQPTGESLQSSDTEDTTAIDQKELLWQKDGAADFSSLSP
jgi:hypothetical protein